MRASVNDRFLNSFNAQPGTDRKVGPPAALRFPPLWSPTPAAGRSTSRSIARHRLLEAVQMPVRSQIDPTVDDRGRPVDAFAEIDIVQL
jgi:hypothetical protein